MKVLVLSLNYAPEPTGFAPHTTAWCEHLAEQGHEVTVFTGFPFAPFWARWPEYRGRLYARQIVNGVHVVRLTHFIPRRPGQLIERLLMEGGFCLSALPMLLARWRRRPDVIVYVGAQPSLACLARLAAQVWCVPYVVKITDLAAHAAHDVGIVRSRWLQGLLAWVEYFGYRRAEAAIVLCAGFREALLARGYPISRVHVVRDSVDLDQIHPMPSDSSFRARHGLTSDDFVVLYAGSMGLKQGLSNVVEAARLVADRCRTVKWVLVGDGELKRTIDRLVANYGLEDQVRLLPLQPEAEMAAMFSAADVLLLNQVRQVKDTVIPSKLLTYMAAGRPVVAAVNPSSQAAALLGEARGGCLVPPEEPSALAAAVTELMAIPNELVAMGLRNRSFAEEHLDRRQIVAAQETILQKAACRSGCRARPALRW